jgi:hypothetical protein
VTNRRLKQRCGSPSYADFKRQLRLHLSHALPRLAEEIYLCDVLDILALVARCLRSQLSLSRGHGLQLGLDALQRAGAPSQLLQSTRRSQHPSGPGSFVFAAQGHVDV